MDNHFCVSSNDIIIAQSVSLAIKQILNTNQYGSVHSVFHHSLNLQIGDRLIHIGSCHDGLAPFGIGIQQKDVATLIKTAQRKQRVTWNPTTKCLAFCSGLLITLKQAETIHHVLTEHSSDNLTLAYNRNFLVNKMYEANEHIGLLQTEEDKNKVMHYLSGSSPNEEHSTISRMRELVSLTWGEESINSESIFDYWIGRGIGLTPSGDDIVTGMCAMLAIHGSLSAVFWEELESYLLQKGRKQTTFIGYEYLYYAIERQYHTRLLEICKAIMKRQRGRLASAIDAMNSIGYTSGTDTLTGVLLGIRAVNSS